MCFCEETCLFSSRGVPEVSYFLGGDSCVLLLIAEESLYFVIFRGGES